MTRVLDQLRRRSAPLTALAVMHLAMLAVFLVAGALDDTLILGINRWIKPAKFAISIAIYLATIAWLLPDTGVVDRARSRVVAIIGATLTYEMLAIGLQAARGTTSHYNIASAFDAAIFSSMGAAILVNTLAAAYLARGAWRRLHREPSGYQSGIVAGFALFLVGSAIGGWLVSNNGHTVGAPDGGPGLPLVNWSRESGDLRIAHFVGLHALQFLPPVGLLCGARVVWIAAGAWLLLTGALALQAGMGLPLFR